MANQNPEPSRPLPNFTIKTVKNWGRAKAQNQAKRLGVVLHGDRQGEARYQLDAKATEAQTGLLHAALAKERQGVMLTEAQAGWPTLKLRQCSKEALAEFCGRHHIDVSITGVGATPGKGDYYAPILERFPEGGPPALPEAEPPGQRGDDEVVATPYAAPLAGQSHPLYQVGTPGQNDFFLHLLLGALSNALPEQEFKEEVVMLASLVATKKGVNIPNTTTLRYALNAMHRAMKEALRNGVALEAMTVEDADDPSTRIYTVVEDVIRPKLGRVADPDLMSTGAQKALQHKTKEARERLSKAGSSKVHALGPAMARFLITDKPTEDALATLIGVVAEAKQVHRLTAEELGIIYLEAALGLPFTVVAAMKERSRREAIQRHLAGGGQVENLVWSFVPPKFGLSDDAKLAIRSAYSATDSVNIGKMADVAQVAMEALPGALARESGLSQLHDGLRAGSKQMFYFDLYPSTGESFDGVGLTLDIARAKARLNGTGLTISERVQEALLEEDQKLGKLIVGNLGKKK